MFRLRISTQDHEWIPIPKNVAMSNPTQELLSFVIYTQLLEEASFEKRSSTLLGAKVLHVYGMIFTPDGYYCLVKLKKWVLYLNKPQALWRRRRHLAVYDPLTRDYVKLAVIPGDGFYFVGKNNICLNEVSEPRG